MSERRDRIRVHIQNMEYSIVGGGFQEMLAAVKQVTGRRFMGELKVWQLPGTPADIEHQLAISGFELEGGTPVAETSPSTTTSTPQSSAGTDRIRVQAGEHRLAVIGGSFQEMLEAVKGIPGRRFDGNSKIWELPGEIGIIKGLIESAGFQLEGAESISLGPISEMEPPSFAETSQNPPPPPSFESPTFEEAAAPIAPMEPPDWWDDDMVPPPMEEWGDTMEESSLIDEPNPFLDEPPSFASPPKSPSAPPAQTPLPTLSGDTAGDRIRMRLGDMPLIVTGGTFQEMLVAVKNIPGRRFNGQDKVWEIPDDVAVDSISQAMQAAGFVLMTE